MFLRPNIITSLRLILIFIIIALDFYGYYFIALILLTLAFLTDLVDGYISRKYNLQSNFGIYFDHFADKVLVHLLLIYFLWQHLLHFPLVALLILRDYLALGFRQYAQSQNLVIASVLSGKIKLWLCAFLLIIIELAKISNIPPETIFALAAITTFWSYISFGDMLLKNKKILKQIKKEF